MKKLAYFLLVFLLSAGLAHGRGMGVRSPGVTVSGDVTINNTTNVNSGLYLEEIDATAGDQTFSLPAAADAEDSGYTIVKVDSSGNVVTVDPDGAETINGSDVYILRVQYEWVSVISDGSTWDVLGSADVGVDVRLFGALGDGSTDDSTEIAAAAAVANASKRPLVFAGSTFRISNDVTFAADTTLQFTPGSMLSIDSGVRPTIQGAIKDTKAQIFTGSGAAWYSVTGTDNSGVDNKTTSMVDTTKNFLALGIRVGDTIRKITDHTSHTDRATITSITTTTNTNDTLNFAALYNHYYATGGADQDFDNGDSYIVFSDLGARKVDYVRPEWFGAAGDGVADDTAEIQAAVNYAQNTIEPLTVLFDERNYLISSAIDVKFRVNLQGRGFGSQIYQSADDHLFNFVPTNMGRYDLDDITVSGLCLGSAATTSGMSLLYLENVSRSKFDNIFLLGSYYGIYIAGSMMNTFSNIKTVHYQRPDFFASDGDASLLNINRTWIYSARTNNISCNGNVFENLVFILLAQ